jgi:hypothetical protein
VNFVMMCVCMCVCNGCMYVCVYVRMYILVCVYVCLYVCIKLVSLHAYFDMNVKQNLKEWKILFFITNSHYGL